MANFGRALQELRQDRNRAEREVERLDNAISILEGLTGRNHTGRSAREGRTARMGRPRRRMTAAGRRKIAAAQRARWARLKEKRPQGEKRRFSVAARNRMAAAQRARWAKLKTAKRQKSAANGAKKPVQKAQAKAA